MSAKELDAAAETLGELEQDVEDLRSRLREQVETFGFQPARSEKSKRVEGAVYQFTLSRSTSVEVDDAQVRYISESCDRGIFDLLFRPVTRYKLVNGALDLLSRPLPAGAPHNLRTLFSRAVTLTENRPRLRVEKIEIEEPAVQ